MGAGDLFLNDLGMLPKMQVLVGRYMALVWEASLGADRVVARGSCPLVAALISICPVLVGDAFQCTLQTTGCQFMVQQTDPSCRTGLPAREV